MNVSVTSHLASNQSGLCCEKTETNMDYKPQELQLKTCFFSAPRKSLLLSSSIPSNEHTRAALSIRGGHPKPSSAEVTFW